MPTTYPFSSISAYLSSRFGCISARPDTPKHLNVRTLLATLGIGISLFIDLTEGRSIQIPGSLYLSISDTQSVHVNVGQTSP